MARVWAYSTPNEGEVLTNSMFKPLSLDICIFTSYLCVTGDGGHAGRDQSVDRVCHCCRMSCCMSCCMNCWLSSVTNYKHDKT